MYDSSHHLRLNLPKENRKIKKIIKCTRVYYTLDATAGKLSALVAKP